MADLNSNSSSLPLPPSNSFALESDDISILVHNLLQSSALPSSSASFDAPQRLDHLQCPLSASAEEEIRRQFCESAGFSDSLGFSSRCGYYDESERCRNAFSSAIEGIGEFDCESEKDQDVSAAPRSSGPLRSSNKRTRAAEIHNLSEKRRRQKINEKMKALQKLIPNCNKTDKASMLDEAIEYLKQLQLQVQMLALRNGSALHPFYPPEVMNAQSTASGICFNGGDGLPSCSRETGPLYADQKIPIQTVFNPSSRCPSSDQKIYMPVLPGTGNSECPSVMEPSTSTHCRPLNSEMPSKVGNGLLSVKDLYGDSKLDVGCCGDESSSGVSS